MTLFLIIVIAIVVWLVRAYFWPFKACPWCKGKGTNRGSGKKRFGDCRFCKGTRRRQVLGSKQVHKAVRSLTARNNRKDRP